MLSHAEVNGSSGSNRLIVLAKAMFFKGSNDQPCRREFRELTRYDKSKLYCEARDEIVKFGMWNVDRRQSECTGRERDNILPLLSTHILVL
jgi:hypothetical protein